MIFTQLAVVFGQHVVVIEPIDGVIGKTIVIEPQSVVQLSVQ